MVDNFDLNIDLDLKFDLDFTNQHENRYINPKAKEQIPEDRLFYSNATKLCNSLEFEKNQRAHVILSGNFIFGDFIEALFVEKNIHTEKLMISTLTLNENNVDSLNNLIKGGFVEKIDLIVSDYFFSHEKYNLIPYLLKILDYEDRLRLGIARTHMKTCLFESLGGRSMVIHGSANLRSSNCLEQITIEENKELFDFYSGINDKIIEEYSIINKSITNKRLWKILTNN